MKEKLRQRKIKKLKENFYGLIKDDHKKHLRQDGRKLFRSVVDYLECYVNGLPQLPKLSLIQDLGLKVREKKISPEVVANVKALLLDGKTLQEAADSTGISIASCQKIKKGGL